MRLPKDSWRACCWACGCGAGLGVDAYNERIDCLRSGLDGAAAVGPVLEGLAGCADAPPPRKSRPNSESPALVCFGGAGSAFGGTLLPIGGPVLGLAGAGACSSPNR